MLYSNEQMIGLASECLGYSPMEYGCVLCSYTHSVEFTSLWKVGVRLRQIFLLSFLFMCVSS